MLGYWLPPLVWMAMIFYFSTDTFSGEYTGSYLESILSFFDIHLNPPALDWIHFLIRKAAHFTEYGILAALLFRAFRGSVRDLWRRSWFIGTLIILVSYALLDEFHQTYTATRYGSLIDSAIDVTGGLVILGLIRLYAKRKAG